MCHALNLTLFQVRKLQSWRQVIWLWSLRSINMADCWWRQALNINWLITNGHIEFDMLYMQLWDCYNHHQSISLDVHSKQWQITSTSNHRPHGRAQWPHNSVRKHVQFVLYLVHTRWQMTDNSLLMCLQSSVPWHILGYQWGISDNSR